METVQCIIKKKYDRLYTKIIDEFAIKFTSEYSLSTYSQGLKYFFSYLCDKQKALGDIDRDIIYAFIENRYENGNSMDTIRQYLERVHFLLINYSGVDDDAYINFLFQNKFIENATSAISMDTLNRGVGNYKKNQNEVSLSSDPAKLKETMKKFHPRG
ncbi:MAG: site-specific integrase [Desulfuromonadales bacterium]|nr:site-specific integrase [Desulfuromonadales bacterium]